MRKVSAGFESQVGALALQPNVPKPGPRPLRFLLKSATAADRESIQASSAEHISTTRCVNQRLSPQQVTQSATMAPKAEKKPAKKVAKSTSSAAAKKRKLAKAETYKIYIYKVLKQARTLKGVAASAGALCAFTAALCSLLCFSITVVLASQVLVSVCVCAACLRYLSALWG